MSTTTDMPTITVEDEQTFRIYAPRGRWVDGGLSPSSLAIGDGRVLIGWVERSDENPDVYFMPSIDECGWEVYQAPVHNEADPAPLPDENGPFGTLETLRSNIKAAPDYASNTPLTAPDRFTLGYTAARRYYGDGAARTLPWPPSALRPRQVRPSQVAAPAGLGVVDEFSGSPANAR